MKSLKGVHEGNVLINLPLLNALYVRQILQMLKRNRLKF